MKLRTQFLLLVGGIIVVPFLVSALALLMQTAFERSHEPLPNYQSINSWMHRRLSRAVELDRVGDVARSRPPGLNFIVVDGEGNVSYSTVASIASGSSAFEGENRLLSYVRSNLSKYHFQIESLPGIKPQQTMVILQVPRTRPDIAHARTSFLQIMTYTSIALLIFSSLMAFFILRSLNESIQSLEGATRRIAEGDLDFELTVQGNDRIASLTRSFDSMRMALKEEYARRSRFIMGVSHDLRTPLALIQGYVEAIGDGLATEPETLKKYLSIILDKTRNLEDTVGELIEFVRMETGQWRMTHREVAMKPFLNEAARRFSEDALILRRNFRSSIDLDEETTVRMDERLCARAIENLVGNAIRYTDVNGLITLAARRDGPDLLLTVQDTGIGIPAEDLTRIYDPFYRSTNSRREQGFGLGLSTAKSIIESHGWTIDVESELNKGTTFTIRMPAAETAATDRQTV